LHDGDLDYRRNFGYLGFDISSSAGIALHHVLALQPFFFAFRRAFDPTQGRDKLLGIARSPEAASAKNQFFVRFPACFRPSQR
jgi:hypothetical protein